MKRARSMALITTVIGVLGLRVNALAQNLVPNGSFEEYTECPFGTNQVAFATGWSPWYRSPEYFNACSESVWADVPLNFEVDQEPSHGAAYCGLAALSGSGDYTELIGAALAEPLIPGVPVFVSLKIAPGVGGTVEDPQYTTSHFGVRFTVTEQIWDAVTPLPNYAHLFLDAPLEEPSQWHTLSGYFLPDSAYEFISIGRFHELDLVLVSEINPDGNYPSAYFLVDEVCVSSDPSYCDFGQGWDENTAIEVEAFPNPFSDGFLIKCGSTLPMSMEITILDALGTRCHQQVASSGKVCRVEGSKLPQGLLTLHIRVGSNLLPPIKIVHLSP